MDGALVSVINSKVFSISNYNNLITSYAASAIKWGTWKTFEEKFYTGGKPATVVVAMIVVVAPMLGFPTVVAAVTQAFAAGAGTTAGLTDYFLVSGKLRYGYDDVYSYYERYTSLIDDEGVYWIRDSYDTGKEYL